MFGSALPKRFEKGMIMAEEGRGTLAEGAARQLANATKTRAQWGGITPRWLIPFLPWMPVEAGIYRLNKVKETRGATSASSADVECSPPRDRDADLPETFVDYDENPREYFLNAVTTVLDVQTRVSDLYSRPFDQIQEQLRLLIEKVKERQEGELINNKEYGLLANTAPSMRISTRTGSPTPDDLDELIAKVWKEPAFFLAHPRAIAAFGRECTRRGVPPPTVNLFGSPFLTWRGLPLVPSDKVPLTAGGKIEDPAAAHGREEAGRRRPVPARRSRRGVARAFRCASWASTGALSPPTLSRSTARLRFIPKTHSACSMMWK